MLLNPRNPKAPVHDFEHRYFQTSQSDNPLVLMVEDQEDARVEMKEVN